MNQENSVDDGPPYVTGSYRTKDFRGVEHGDLFRVIGTHSAARKWLAIHAHENHRAQFMNEGALLAHDEVELEALIFCLQKEYGP
jgi:hypothetical protein